MKRLAQLAVNDDGFVFDPSSGDSYHVSRTGLQVLNGLKAGRAEEAIAQALVEDYEVGLEDARRDVADFLASLRNLGLA